MLVNVVTRRIVSDVNNLCGMEVESGCLTRLCHAIEHCFSDACLFERRVVTTAHRRPLNQDRLSILLAERKPQQHVCGSGDV